MNKSLFWIVSLPFFLFCCYFSHSNCYQLDNVLSISFGEKNIGGALGVGDEICYIRNEDQPSEYFDKLSFSGITCFEEDGNILTGLPASNYQLYNPHRCIFPISIISKSIGQIKRFWRFPFESYYYGKNRKKRL